MNSKCNTNKSNYAARGVAVFLLVVCLMFCNAVMAQSSNQMLSAAKGLIENSKYHEAKKVLNAAIQQDPNLADLYVQRAKVYYYIEEYELALEDCYRAIEIEDDPLPEIYLLRGDICMVTNSYGGAVMFYSKAKERYLGQANEYYCLLKRGQAYMELGKVEDAYNDFYRAYDKYFQEEELLLPMARSLILLKRDEEALYIIDKLLSQNPNSREALLLRSDLFMEMQEYNQAIETLNKAIAVNPSDVDTYNTLANIYILKDSLNMALYHINQAFKFDSVNAMAFKQKGMIMLEVSKNEQACNLFFRAFQEGYLERHEDDLLEIYINNCE